MHIYPEFLALKIVLSRLPYFYIIQHINTGAYYAGYKCRKPNSSIFMTTDGYQTSSKTVKNIIAQEGLEAFKIVRIHHFDTSEEAFEYETRFLKKVGVPYNPRFLNQHVTNNFGNTGKKFSEEHKAKLKLPRGPHSKETKAKMRKPKTLEHKIKLLGNTNASGGKGKKHLKQRTLEHTKNQVKSRSWYDDQRKKETALLIEKYRQEFMSSNLTRKQFAELHNISYVTVKRYLRGL
jgi:hypothetical protein